MVKALPIPTTAPDCETCGKRLRAHKFFGHSVIDPQGVRRWGYEGNNVFCTLRCGFNHALVRNPRWKAYRATVNRTGATK